MSVDNKTLNANNVCLKIFELLYKYYYRQIKITNFTY